MAAGDIYRLAVRWDRAGSGDDAVNVFHFQQGEGTLVFDTPAEDLVGGFIADVELAYSNCVSPLYVIGLYSVRQITGGSEEYEQAASVAGNVGTAATTLSYQTAGIVSWRTGLAGRSNRGRTFLPPSVEAELDSGLWNNDYLARMQDFADQMINTLGSATLEHVPWPLVIWSPTNSTFRVVTTAVIQNVPGVIRSRRLGSGS